MVPREIYDNGYVKIFGLNKVHYGLYENGELEKQSLDRVYMEWGTPV